jgi:hypothetical protein
MYEVCDRCGFTAQVRVELVSGGELFFCPSDYLGRLAAIQRVFRRIEVRDCYFVKKTAVLV